MAKLLTVTDLGEMRALQGEVAAYQRILDYQQKPPITPKN